MRTIALSALVAAGAVLGACGSAGDAGSGNPTSQATDYEKALAGAPPELAKLYADGDALLPGAVDELDKQLAAVKGYPAVVNVWASWCGPCRFEFPVFQKLAADEGDRIAFLGVDTQDSDAAAETFLKELPLPYPSVTDPDRQVFDEYKLRGVPATAFYDSAGELQYVKQGPYTSEADLRADIARYAS